MKNGKIIFLNGTSSSGKTATAKALQQLLDAPYVCMALDDISGVNEWYSRKPERLNQFPPQNLILGFYHAIAGYSRAGVGVIIDHCTTWDAGMRECMEIFRDARVIFVEVVCPVHVLREREKARGNRKVGQAETQIPGHEAFRARFPCDLQVDTSLHSPEECARMVIALLNDSTVKTSFEKMRESNTPTQTVSVPNRPATTGGNNDKPSE